VLKTLMEIITHPITGDSAAIASIPRRFLALVLDGLVLGWLAELLEFGFWEPSRATAFALVLLLAASSWLYTFLCHGYKGQTLGKAIMQLQVIEARGTEGNPISMRRSFLRSSLSLLLTCYHLAMVGWMLLSIDPLHFGAATALQRSEWVCFESFIAAGFSSGGLLFVEVLVMLCTQQRKTLHDLLARTVVVDLRRIGIPVHPMSRTDLREREETGAIQP
jgi:uncharacterized RDD family membrane protein YckC